MIDLNELCKMAYENTCKRAEHEPEIKTRTMEALKHCAGEVVEATEAFNDWSRSYSTKDIELTQTIFADELADIICCVLTICGKHNIDIEYALTMCMEKNANRAERGRK